VRDVAVVAGIALTMLGIKALKILPGLPFAPGHKGVILIPLYIAAGALTRSRLGATLTGLTMGTVAFLMGDGRYGVFEIAKHVAPGVLVDLLLPLMGRRPQLRGVVAWSLFGLIVALGRFATVTAHRAGVQAPALSTTPSSPRPRIACHVRRAFGHLDRTAPARARHRRPAPAPGGHLRRSP
jgi:hypothetical protein